MATPAQLNRIIAILEASKLVPPHVMEQICQVAGESDSEILENLASYNLVSLECVDKLQEFLTALDNNYVGKNKKRDDKLSLFSLPPEKKKDILFARQVITEGISAIEDINLIFVEQSGTEAEKGKSAMLGQLMVKKHLLPVDRFVKILREIEIKVKEQDIDKLLTDDKSLRVCFQDTVIQLAEGYIPEKFGPYRIIEEVAKGGMGVVYKAWDAKLKRPVALKVLKAWENPPLEEIQRFHREARLAASLNHPNIVRIYDAGVVEGVHYFTMDYVEGEPLSEYLASKQPSYREALVFIREIALALGYAHSNGIIHRDVKPGNIILDITNRPLLTDFGLAKGINTPESRHLTKSGTAIGTPAYMSPEQARGDSTIDARSDIYSLGAVLYEMVTGRPPFEGDAVGPIISAVLQQEPIPPSKINPNLHPHVEIICLKAMAKDPEQRYTSAKELADDIDRFMYGETIKAKPISKILKLWHKATKNLSLIVPLIAIIGMIFLVGGWMAIGYLLAYSKAYNNYQQGLRYLQNGDYGQAIKFFQQTGGHKGLYVRIINQLRHTAAKHIEVATQLLSEYDRDRNDLQRYLQRELEKFTNAETIELKRNSLLEWQNLQDLNNSNWQKLLVAADNFRQALQCEPFNKVAASELAKVYFYRLRQSEEKDDRAAMSWQRNQLEFLLGNKLATTYQPGSLTIDSRPGQARVYVFTVRDLYRRRIAIGYNQWRAWHSKSNKDSGAREIQKYLDIAYPVLDGGSFCGKTPLTLKYLDTGYYLVILQMPGYSPTSDIVKIATGADQKVSRQLPQLLPELKNFIAVDFPEAKVKYHYLLSRQEVTCQQYSDFLNDNAILRKYAKKMEQGVLRYVPRLGTQKRWSLHNGNFVCASADLPKPVSGISWEDAVEYCSWLRQKADGRILYRLPFRSEWMWAFGKIDGRNYPWGEYFDKYFVSMDRQSLAIVGLTQFDVSPYGIENMASNVSEWCLDNKQASKRWAVICGGNWRGMLPEDFRIDHCVVRSENYVADNVGFRVMALLPRDK